MESAEVKVVLSTILDGRARDVRFRQRQFHSLHQWIISHTTQVETAIRDDTGFSDVQAKYIISQTLSDLRRNYEKLDLKQALQAEYSVKQGRNNENGSVPEELVYIVSEKYTPFYSVLVALFACIAAGSCCLIELPDDSTQSVAMTRQCLTEALDKTAYVIVNTRPSSTILGRCLLVDQLGSVQSSISKRILKSQPHLWTVAVVDRDTNLQLAAKCIYASLAFSKSPYAPNCILVNEFVEEAFVQLLREFALEKHHLHEVAVQDDALLQTESFRIVKASKRADLKLHTSSSTCLIPLLSTSSHEDTIDAIERHHEEPLLASYVFAAPAAAKYLTQFIRSNVSFVNHIPASLLIGPAAPIGYHVSPTARYNDSMMRLPSPKFVTSSIGELTSDQLVSKNSQTVERIYNQSMKPLPATGQPKDGDRNFFLQGFTTGAVFIALPLLVATGGALTYTGRTLYRYWR